MILVLIGELIIVFPNRKIDLAITSSSDDSAAYGLSSSRSGSTTIEIWLWTVSNFSVFVIPSNTFLISIALRILFCKLHYEYTKVLLLVLLAGLYVSTGLGLVSYVQAPQQDYFKQNFFLQYIIMAVALVLGFLALFIAMVVLSYSLMKTTLSSITQQGKYFQEEYDQVEERLAE